MIPNPLAELHRIEIEEARRRLIPYVKGNVRGYLDGWVHREIADELEQFSKDVAAGLSPRLMIFMPPRHGKSELASIQFPAWHMGKHPEHEVILASYSGDLGANFAGKALDMANGDWHREVYPDFELRDKKPKKANWRTKAGGGMTGTGVGGPITGKGAHVVILDDLVKNWEEAISKTIRDKVWDFYASTIRTRLAPGGGIILIMTRWHEDDVAGRLLKQMRETPGARQWKVIEYPAIAEKAEEHRAAGEALHPERYSLAELQDIERDVGPRVWIALFQQKPRPLGGQYIKGSWFKQIDPDEVPDKGLRWVRFWDLAVHAKKANDETASVQMAVVTKIPEGGKKPLTYVYARTMYAWKKEWPDTKLSLVSIATAEKVLVGIESNSAFDIAVQEIRSDLKGKAMVQGVPVSKDKLTRAIPWMDIAEAGRFYLIGDSNWIPAFLAEVEGWDPLQNDQQDNRIDAVSGAYMMVGGRKLPGVL